MVCIVGAGGKTSTMFRLAQELSSKGKRVLVTTTTAIYYPEKWLFDNIIVSEKEDMDLFKSSSDSCITVFGRVLSSEGKLLGINPKFLDAIFLKDIFDYIIVEGDGSKGRSVKAPAEHEPVIPSNTTKLVGLIGMDCIGKYVCAENVHRAERLCSILGCREGDLIDTKMIEKLILHKQGLFKAAPKQTEKYLILNKADGENERQLAYDIVQKILDTEFVLSGIIISSMKNSNFQNAVKEVESMISGIILAAGLSRRMGMDKLLLSVAGIPIIQRVLAAASKSRLDEIILVCANDEVAEIGSIYGITVVRNTSQILGQSHSIKLGVQNSSMHADGFMFFVGDQPFMTEDIINRLINAFQGSNCIATVPLYNNKRGNPVIFSSKLRNKLLSLNGDVGGRTLLAELDDKIVTVSFDYEAPGLDVDTQEDYKTVLKLEDKNG